MTLTSTLLRVNDISKSYPGVVALRDAALEAHAEEAVALVGANGTGKSALINVLGDVLAPNAGSMEIGAKQAVLRSPRNAARAGIALVHQELTMFGTMTVAENIFIDDLPLRFWQPHSREMDIRAVNLMARLGTNFPPDTPVEQLSAGDRQLVEIARALRRNSKIIILDEPTSSLTDPEPQCLFEVVRSLKASGAAVIYITHFLDEILGVCDRVTAMRDGEHRYWGDRMPKPPPRPA